MSKLEFVAFLAGIAVSAGVACLIIWLCGLFGDIP